MRNKFFCPLLLPFAIFLLLLLMPACSGGGTIGTGGGNGERINGRIIDQTENPLPAVEVSIEHLSVSSTTDAEGNFAFEVDNVPEEFQLELRSENLDTSIQIESISEQAVEVRMDVVVDQERNSVEEVRLEVFDTPPTDSTENTEPTPALTPETVPEDLRDTAACQEVFFEAGPVCGLNGVTYANACEAQLAGVMLLEGFGPCNQAPVCHPDLLDTGPVCAVDGTTYNNGCDAFLAEAVLIAFGPCSAPCTGGSPVCGVDGHTYENQCTAANAGVAVAENMACELVGECPFGDLPLPVPICGTDGVTYTLRCDFFEANQAGIEAAGFGPCP